MIKTKLSKALSLATITLAMGAISTSAFAHSTFSEKERARKANFKDNGNPMVAPQEGEDFDFEHPFDITQQTAHKTYVPYPPFEITQYPRPDVAIGVDSTLRGKKDFDVFQYEKFGTDTQIFSAYPIVPYCRNIQNFHPEIALAGPVDTVGDDGDLVFTDDINDLPDDVADALPDGYGVKIVDYNGAALKDRPTYYSPHAFNMWYLPEGIHDGECIEGLDDLEGINAIRTAAGEPACEVDNTIYEKISVPGTYYYIVWHKGADKKGKGKRGKNYRFDYTLVTGTIDSFQAYDWGRVFARAGESSWGADLSYNCKLPTNAPHPFEIPVEEPHDHD